MRVEPGVVQEDLNRAAKRLGLGFGPDTSTSNRATLGGMIGNNSSGSESIVHGTTIDHVLELEVVLADGSRATFSRDVGPASAFERRIHVGVERVLRDHARAIAEDYPQHWRQSGGYRLDRMDPFDLVEADRRLRGHAGDRHRGDRAAGRAAEGEDVRRRALRRRCWARSPPPTTRSRSSRARSR